MFVSWTALELAAPAAACPWRPDGAAFSQAGVAGPGRAELPEAVGSWWSVLGTWEDPAAALAAAPLPDGSVRGAWHVVLQPVSYRGTPCCPAARGPSTGSRGAARWPVRPP
ncbi:hypothetical protein JD79_02526 [Geodermatophilus normandii]|uniref:Uncharacterized protein n=1 Tax=Geodermatophilus normandii TaxID=1137989 RepID=A0A317QJ59_9ACTN|nr:hypothetical protein [Geodermatophilus normandii]PWW23352.1 hypothetical protein JD79_02526 [Geodermatophilus normandii]